MNTTHARSRFRVAAGTRRPVNAEQNEEVCRPRIETGAAVCAISAASSGTGLGPAATQSDFSRTSTAGSPLALPYQRFTAHSCATSPDSGIPNPRWPLSGIFILCGEALPDSGIPTFRALWDSINAKRGYGWDENPWVWIIEFEVIHKNIDEALS